MKRAYYFSHDYNARNDSKMQRLQMRHRLGGIGCYWCIIEMLYEEGGAIPVSEYERISFELRTEYDMIKSVVEEFDLFVIKGGVFRSKSVTRRLEECKIKSNKARESVSKRWAKLADNQIDADLDDTNDERCSNTNVSEIDTNELLIKEKKIKDKKDNSNELSKKDAAKAATLARRDNFYKSLAPFVGRYTPEMIRGFFEYWSELTRCETKMRFEKQTTWETAKRLATWANKEKFNGNGKNRTDSKEDKKRQLIAEFAQLGSEPGCTDAEILNF